MATRIRLDDKVATAIKRLKGEPIDRGVAELTKEYLERKIADYSKRLRVLREKHGSKERLEQKVLKDKHTWNEEEALFDWESLQLELRKLNGIVRELGD